VQQYINLLTSSILDLLDSTEEDTKSYNDSEKETSKINRIVEVLIDANFENFDE